MNVFTLQEKIHHHIWEVGGYWRPISAVLRMYEEIGEIFQEIKNNGKILDEVADLIIITVCIANQYCVDLSSYTSTSSKIDIDIDMTDILSTAGEIARVVNAYDGEKTPKINEHIGPIGPLIITLHHQILEFCHSSYQQIEPFVHKKLDLSKTRDKYRFVKKYDPTLCDNYFKSIDFIKSSNCIFANSAKIWFSPSYNSELSFDDNMKTLNELFTRYIKISKYEDLDGIFFLYPNQIKGPHDLSILLKNTLRSLNPSLDFSEESVHKEDFQFHYNGHRFFIVCFSAFYPHNHSRYSHGLSDTVLFFHSENSFQKNNLTFNHTCEKKLKIRNHFTDRERKYEDFISFSRNLEAYRYIKPINKNEIIKWWLND